MLGRKSKVSNTCNKQLYEVSVDRFKVDAQVATFLPVLPHVSTIKDIIFYKPFFRDETVNATIYIDNGNTPRTFKDLTTNELNPINLKLQNGGLVPIVITSIKITKLVVYYEV